MKSGSFRVRIVVYRSVFSSGTGHKFLWKRTSERVIIPSMLRLCYYVRCAFDESSCLGLQPKMGGKFHLKLNIGERPIANKYREGKMKRTLKRELKVPEIVEREAIGSSVG